jgi:hypothetical protein
VPLARFFQPAQLQIAHDNLTFLALEKPQWIYVHYLQVLPEETEEGKA